MENFTAHLQVVEGHHPNIYAPKMKKEYCIELQRTKIFLFLDIDSLNINFYPP